jgi:hypothetical protein
MIGYAKFAVMILAAAGIQWTIESNHEDVAEAVFTLRCGATNLIGNADDRTRLLEHAMRLRERQEQLIMDELRAMPPEQLDQKLRDNGCIYLKGAIITASAQ